MRRVRLATQLRKAVKTPHCQAIKANGYACTFPQETNGEGYFTGACANEFHRAQVRDQDTDS